MKSSSTRKRSDRSGSKSAKSSAVKFQAWWLIAGVVLIAAFAGVYLLNRAPAEAAAAPAEINVATGYEHYQAGAFVLDVRTPEEWNDFHVDGSTLIPLNELAARVKEVPRDQEILVVCRSGNRSQEGRDILKAAGFTNVTSMAGGLNQWRSAGYPTISGP